MGNDLNHESREGRDLVVGLDAGGTRTRAVLAAADDGRVLGESTGGPGNAMTVPLPQLTDHLAEALARVVPEEARARVVAVTGGFAGATAASEDDPGTGRARTALTGALRRLGIPADRVGVCSDIEAAFAAAPGTPSDGLALVAGTGAVAMRITGRHATTTVDGDGWLLGDEGSGFWIGRSAVRAALRMADGRGRPTVLAGWVGRALDLPLDILPKGAIPSYDRGGPALPSDTPSHPTGVPGWERARREDFRRRLLPAVMADPPIRLARFAPLVAEAAAGKDAVAGAILSEAADHLLETVRALEPRPGERIVATGGLLGPEGPLTAPLSERLHAHGLSLDWVADGRPGAVALARLARPS
ncbi:N-acetylglucosamine kinase-like BadF-type ATPase [Streptomyces sp. SAI-135]|jgi:N-acetylglucosamine kinase-like BadF-type ATPase|uniref:N-acetylglucosamine kinase n=1 Tax=unclassified Streptomyces TaxID=2593676 RepID=UPI0024737859|nr:MULTISPECIES: BadF/BadG/BcrA/BcrD ATPase family protein [unclassified Streptomyces]MDH6515820.1 N-acetylglucosamine kinase-like BadF-type ATPase [Streptomyces sp. SAI-090]MDH6620096.1 N-acetylglucosamine kinase-like BadF-type ATPase [Streptomyces sp. SAI-135]